MSSSSSLSNTDDFFLSTHFQAKIEESEYHSNLPSDETRPFDNKYAARKILEALNISKEVEALTPDNKAIAKGIISYLLANNFFDTEENSYADKFFLAALESFSHLKKDKIFLFFNYLQDIYNSLGILYTNREDIENGLGLFTKAEDLFSFIKNIHAKNPVNVVHNLRYIHLSGDFVDNNNSSQDEKSIKSSKKFQFYYQGGLSLTRAEKSYTLTLFYMAQAYAKIGMKVKAAQYCGWTLKRQFETGDYEMKDWSINCLSLAEYYDSSQEFAQSQYLLMSGLNILPDDTKKKLHATFYMALGHHLLEYLAFAVEKILGGETEDKEAQEALNRKTIVFTNGTTEFVEFKMPKTTEDISSIFRQMNTQLKKAMKHYELDGYVTEYIQIARDLSRGYRFLMMIEKDKDRLMALLERRRELLEYPAKEINPKAYELYWQV